MSPAPLREPPVAHTNPTYGTFPPLEPLITTHLDMEDCIRQILLEEDDQDGAEGLPLAFDLSALNEALTPSPSTHRLSETDHTSSSAAATPASPIHSVPSSAAAIPLPLRICNSVAHSGIQKRPTHMPTDRKKLKSKLKSLARRRTNAIAAASSRLPNFFRTPRLASTQHLPLPDIIPTDLDRKSLPVATNCWVGRSLNTPRSTPWTLAELIEDGFKIVEWDGRSTKIITDKDGNGIVFFVGGPMGAQGSEWDGVAQRVAETMESVRKEGERTNAFVEKKPNRRGNFVAMAVGVSHGGGQKAPGTLVQSPERQELIKRLLSDLDIQRFAGYQSSALSYYSPGHYARYCHRLLRVYEHDVSLKRNFKESIFPAVSLNLGPATVSLEHTDSGNVGYGFCALAAFGSFDPRAGGHLILFDLGLVVEFPPGSIALLLSGILRHGNTPIQTNERRYSMAQYCAGGLLRWLHYGFRTEPTITKGKTPKQAKKMMAAINGLHEERVREALGLFTKVEELDRVRRSTYAKFQQFLMNPLPGDT